MAEANNSKLIFPVSMEKIGFSREEIEKIIHSKAQAIFGNDVNTNEVVRKLAISETKDGNMDKRTISTKRAQESGAVPASPDGKTQKGPKALAPQHKDDWAKHIKTEQQDLFDLLFDNSVLDNSITCVEGRLKKNSEVYCCVGFCNFLDSLAIQFKDRKPSTHDRKWIIKVRDLCESITHLRICTGSAFSDEDYNQRRKHLWMIASFAALMIGLTIYLNKEMDKNEHFS